MNESKPTASGAEEAGPRFEAPGWTRFVGIEGMQAAAEADGWSIEYRQIAAGRMTASAATVDCAGIALLDERVSSRIEVVGETPEAHITVTLPAGGGRLWINGKWSTGQGFYVSEPSAGMHFFTEQDTRALTMHVPMSLLPTLTYADLAPEDARSRIREGWFEPCPASAEWLRRLVDATTHRLVSGRWQVEQGSALVAALLSSIDESDGAPAELDHASRAERRRVIRRAREFIDAHLTEPIRIGQLSEYCAASLSKIERTFRRELQMSPREYIRARRLAAAQRELKRADPESTTVARVATDHGFGHLGRFAGAYRAQFGELPSETLSSS
jgi:AraC-like DNA-binding protein